MTPKEKEFADRISGLHYSNGHQQNIATGYCTPDCQVCNDAEENQKWLAWGLIALMIVCALFSGCAEAKMYDKKEDCRGRDSVKERNTPYGYPCRCCPE